MAPLGLPNWGCACCPNCGCCCVYCGCPYCAPCPAPCPCGVLPNNSNSYTLHDNELTFPPSCPVYSFKYGIPSTNTFCPLVKYCATAVLPPCLTYLLQLTQVVFDSPLAVLDVCATEKPIIESPFCNCEILASCPTFPVINIFNIFANIANNFVPQINNLLYMQIIVYIFAPL